MDLPCEYPKDIWATIIGHIDCGSAYKAVCSTNHAFLSIARKAHPAADTEFANHLITLLTMIDRGDYLPRGFETRKLFIESPPASGMVLTSNPNLTLEFIDSHEWLWNRNGLVQNPNITTEWLEANEGKFCDYRGGVWGIISHHPCITIDYVCATPHHAWDVPGLSRNPNITPEIINSYPKIPWGPHWLYLNPSITWDFIKSRLDVFSGCEELLSQWPLLTIENVLECPNVRWDWACLAAHPNISLEIIESHPGLPWWTGTMINNPNITIEYVLDHPDYRWNWKEITTNPNMTVEIIKNNPELPWVKRMIIKNPNITWKVVEDHPDGLLGQPWDIPRMGHVSGLTWKKIIELDRAGTRWNWRRIFQNHFGKSALSS